jgi:hypothetical protein
MRTTLLLASIIALALPGCIGLGCGAYQGAGDEVYARGQDQLVVCANGGFVATTSAGTIEGRVGNDDLVEGDDDTVVSQLVYDSDGSVMTPDLGTTAWQPVSEDKTGLDHADTLCQALETRAWWTPSS